MEARGGGSICETFTTKDTKYHEETLETNQSQKLLGSELNPFALAA